MSTTNQDLSLMDLFKVGAHRGNKKHKSNPRLKKYIYGNSQSLSLIDLSETLNSIQKVESFLENIGKRKKQILIVGTSKHLQKMVAEFAGKFGTKGMPYVSHRWLGGTLTNWSTIKKTLKHLEKNENIISNEKFFNELSRNEKLRMQRETDKLKKVFDGLKPLKFNRPAAVLVLDSMENAVAIKESITMNIPVIALANTSVTQLPKTLDYTIICNNNSTKLVEMMLERFVNAYNSGLSAIVLDNEKDDEQKKDNTKDNKVNKD